MDFVGIYRDGNREEEEKEKENEHCCCFTQDCLWQQEFFQAKKKTGFCRCDSSLRSMCNFTQSSSSVVHSKSLFRQVGLIKVQEDWEVIILSQVIISQAQITIQTNFCFNLNWQFSTFKTCKESVRERGVTGCLKGGKDTFPFQQLVFNWQVGAHHVAAARTHARTHMCPSRWVRSTIRERGVMSRSYPPFNHVACCWPPSPARFISKTQKPSHLTKCTDYLLFDSQD